MRFRDVHVNWECEACGKGGEFDVIRGKGLPWHVVSEQIEAEHKKVSPACKAAGMTRMKLNFTRTEEGNKAMASAEDEAKGIPHVEDAVSDAGVSPAVPLLDFHIYVKDGSVQVVMDGNDPQRTELMKAMAEIFNKNDRYREADECLGIGIKG